MIVDTGDRVEGNGLYDASDPKGQYTFDIVSQQHMDVITIGNHELYKNNASQNEYKRLVPTFRDSYISSNVDIIDPKTNETVPLAPRFRKITTKQQGIRICAFGFLFDFYRNANNTRVQLVEDAIKEDWFQEAIRDADVDLFLVAGHAAVRSHEFDAIFKAIRAVKWDTPIQFLGGHQHIRDYKKFDSKAFGLASGRFMETIGFQSISGLSTGSKDVVQNRASFKFSRRYIDNNLFSFYHHTGLNESTFPTEQGTKVSKQIKAARKNLDLDDTFGCATDDLWMSRAKYPSKDSIFSWIEEQVFPDVINDTTRSNKARLAFMNTGGIRFDILKGPFTRDSTFMISPFTSGFRYIKDVPFDKAKKILDILNNNGPIFHEADPQLQTQFLSPPAQGQLQHNIHYDVAANLDRSGSQIHLGSKPNLTPGYTTKDDAGNDGDDTLHSAITFYDVPNCIQALVKPSAMKDDPEVVDLVFIDFIQPWMLLALKFTGLEYDVEDVADYMEGQNLTTLLARWVSHHWKKNC